MTTARIRCDGCSTLIDASKVLLEHADGHEARYCDLCFDAYAQWVTTCQQEEARLNSLLDAFIHRTREHIPLKFVPQDLPRERSRGLVLG